MGFSWQVWSQGIKFIYWLTYVPCETTQAWKHENSVQLPKFPKKCEICIGAHVSKNPLPWKSVLLDVKKRWMAVIFREKRENIFWVFLRKYCIWSHLKHDVHTSNHVNIFSSRCELCSRLLSLFRVVFPWFFNHGQKIQERGPQVQKGS